MRCQHEMPLNTKRCHCAKCCLTFSGVSAFDKHITRDGHQAPQERGLVQAPSGIWTWPPEAARGQRPSFLEGI